MVAEPKWGFIIFCTTLAGGSACPTSQDQHLSGAGAFACQRFWGCFPNSVKHPQANGLLTDHVKWALRELALRYLVLFGTVTALLTELLSPFHLLRRGPIAGAWIVVLAGAAVYLYVRPPELRRPRILPFEGAIAAAIVAIAVCVGLAAILSPPNSTDAMAYHMPRVVYWAQSGSVAFFPTPYFNQITLQPLAEYLMLHTYVLSGGDHLVNLVAFLGFLGSIVGVSAIAARMGLGSRGQAFAALFCATMPNGILQASGAKNDSLLALWLVSMVYFAVRRDAAFLGLSLGLALATKATAYLFAPPLLIAALLVERGADESILRGRRHSWRQVSAVLVGGVLLINAPQYVRNLRLSGSPLGPDSAQGDGVFRWRNEHPGWRSTVSNALRNLSEQLGARSPRWNQAVFRSVLRIHGALGLNPQDPDTTWPWAEFEPPLNANHEANANNRWHLLLLGIALAVAAFTRKRPWMLYGAGLLAGALLFCFYLKWQPFLARLELPLFVAGAPLAASVFDWGAGGPRTSRIWRTLLALLVCYFFADTGRRPALENWTRPLKGPRSLLVTARDNNYFTDMVLWNNSSSYLEAAGRTARSGCRMVGLDIGQNTLEYPFQALLLERNPAVRFVHVGVENASARYAPPEPPHLCAVLCPDCAGIQKKIAMYDAVGPPITIGHFLLFLEQ